MHLPGPYGTNVPVAGATVQIYDIDKGGDGNDLLWQGTTNASGDFVGESREWIDTNTVSIQPPFGPSITQHVPDVLSLVAKIRQGSREATIPFAFLGNNVVSPIIVPWAHVPAVVGKVNGVACSTPQELQTRAKAAIDAGTSPIRVEVFGPDAVALNPLAQPADQLRAWVRQRVDPRNSLMGAWGGDDVAIVLVGVACVIIAAAGLVIAAAVGAALIYAIYKGYKSVEVQNSTSADGQTSTTFVIKRS